MDFATALKTQLENMPKRSVKEQSVLDIVNAKDSRRRTRRLHRMENAARGGADLHPEMGEVDWGDRAAGGQIDWKNLLSTILGILVKLLPLLLAI